MSKTRVSQIIRYLEELELDMESYNDIPKNQRKEQDFNKIKYSALDLIAELESLESSIYKDDVKNLCIPDYIAYAKDSLENLTNHRKGFSSIIGSYIKSPANFVDSKKFVSKLVNKQFTVPSRYATFSGLVMYYQDSPYYKHPGKQRREEHFDRLKEEQKDEEKFSDRDNFNSAIFMQSTSMLSLVLSHKYTPIATEEIKNNLESKSPIRGFRARIKNFYEDILLQNNSSKTGKFSVKNMTNRELLLNIKNLRDIVKEDYHEDDKSKILKRIRIFYENVKGDMMRYDYNAYRKYKEQLYEEIFRLNLPDRSYTQEEYLTNLQQFLEKIKEQDNNLAENLLKKGNIPVNKISNRRIIILINELIDIVNKSPNVNDRKLFLDNLFQTRKTIVKETIINRNKTSYENREWLFSSVQRAIDVILVKESKEKKEYKAKQESASSLLIKDKCQNLLDNLNKLKDNKGKIEIGTQEMLNYLQRLSEIYYLHPDRARGMRLDRILQKKVNQIANSYNIYNSSSSNQKNAQWLIDKIEDLKNYNFNLSVKDVYIKDLENLLLKIEDTSAKRQKALDRANLAVKKIKNNKLYKLIDELVDILECHDDKLERRELVKYFKEQKNNIAIVAPIYKIGNGNASRANREWFYRSVENIINQVKSRGKADVRESLIKEKAKILLDKINSDKKINNQKLFNYMDMLSHIYKLHPLSKNLESDLQIYQDKMLDRWIIRSRAESKKIDKEWLLSRVQNLIDHGLNLDLKSLDYKFKINNKKEYKILDLRHDLLLDIHKKCRAFRVYDLDGKRQIYIDKILNADIFAAIEFFANENRENINLSRLGKHDSGIANVQNIINIAMVDGKDRFFENMKEIIYYIINDVDINLADKVKKIKLPKNNNQKEVKKFIDQLRDVLNKNILIDSETQISGRDTPSSKLLSSKKSASSLGSRNRDADNGIFI